MTDVDLLTKLRSSLYIATCADLTPPTGATITYSPSTTPRLVGTVATHTCNTGYTLSSVFTATRMCQSDMQWSGSAPMCECTLLL